MVFNTEGMVLGLLVFLVLWASVLSAILLRTRAHYNKLTHGITKHSLAAVLERILHRQQEFGVASRKLEEAIELLSRDGAFHMSRIGLVRFNPFSDTGGSQSFTLALLDGRANGLVMTSLYARTGNRWYVKEVRGGRGKGIELSREEASAIKRAEVVQEATV